MLFYSNDAQNVLLESNGNVLKISKPDGVISSEKGYITGQRRQIAGILGIIQLRLTKYVILIKDAETVGHLWDEEHVVFKAQSYEFIPLKEWRVKDESERQYLQLLRSHLDSANLFFSYTWDLTNSLQRQGQQLGEGIPLWERADDRFFWNRYVSSDLIDAATSTAISSPDNYRAISSFILPVMYGVVSIQHTEINGHAALFAIITRRSRFRAGTRYFRRGIDQNGQVANYNETEQILVVQNSHNIFSYVQTRGSVPAFWGEINNLRYKPVLKVGEQSSVNPARLHFNEQYKTYGHNILVNLVNSKGYELPVKEVYEQTVQSLDDKNIDYVYFDFHKECSKMRWHRVDNLLQQLLDMGLDKFAWYEATTSDEKGLVVVETQKGVVRTNCMDCLDRTNVVQSHIGKWVLQKQLEKSGILAPGQSWEVTDKVFLKSFRAAWADNADGVSCAYSGTGALKTDFTRLGKRTKLGALQDLRNSIVRYVKNNYLDGPRQDGFDLFLGNHLPYEAVQPPFSDLRPLRVQIIPYVILGAIIMIFSLVLFPREDAPWLANQGMLVLCVLTLLVSLRSLLTNGLQYVNWPKLCPVDFVNLRKIMSSGGETKGYLYDSPSHSVAKFD